MTNWTSGFTYTTATTNNTTPIFYVTEPSTIAVTPAKPKPKTPLEWLREQVDEVCQLARNAA